jgi:hypothetical protein
MNETSDGDVDQCVSLLRAAKILVSAFAQLGGKSIADDWQRFGLVGICA